MNTNDELNLRLSEQKQEIIRLQLIIDELLAALELNVSIKEQPKIVSAGVRPYPE